MVGRRDSVLEVKAEPRNVSWELRRTTFRTEHDDQCVAARPDIG
jgi:hypothetical protein